MGLSISVGQGAAVAALTDNSGGAAADGTVGAVTAPTSLTDSSGGTASTILAAVSNALAGGIGLSSPTAAAVNTELGTIRNAIASLAARQVEDRTAVIALTDAVKELTTRLATLLTSLRNASLIAP